MRTSLSVLLSVIAACGPLLASTDPAERSAMRRELERLAEQDTLSRAFNLIHELVGPSVVSIHINQEQLRLDRRTGAIVRNEVQVGEGSGFVVAADQEHAWVLTNAHVVIQTNSAQEFLQDRDGNPAWYRSIRVASNDNRVFDGVPVGADVQSDLAVLRIAAPDLPAITWGDGAVAVGDWVVALGYPLGVGYSASAGIVSATDRSTGIYLNEGGFEAFIQTDAAINPGNSGGPLVDLRGRVVGVNANIVSRTGASIGLGFAIPADLAQRVADDLVAFGRVRRPFIGVRMDELAPELADDLAIDNRAGVVLTRVLPGSPAEQAGLREGDVVVAVAGAEVNGIQDFRASVAATRLGSDLPVTVWRDRGRIELSLRPVSLEEFRNNAENLVAVEARMTVEWPRYGLTLATDRLRGLVIRRVERGSPAAAAGLQPGHRILRIGGIGPVDELDQARGLDASDELVLEVYRAGRIVLKRLRPRS